MISVKKAQEIIREHQPQGTTIRIPIEQSLHCILAEDVYAPIDLPVFDNSAMDGYALRSADTEGASFEDPVSLAIVDDMWAGKNKVAPIQEDTSVRIMTGAKIPEGADAVIELEAIRTVKNLLVISSFVLTGKNIRRTAEEVRKGDIVLSKRHLLNPASIGLLAHLGITECSVIKKPRVTIVTTGSELTSPGTPLHDGMIYESNSFTLIAALQDLNIPARAYGPIDDDPQELFEAVEQALTKSTHLIVCGGVSKGTYDFNKGIFQDLGIRELFWQVNQKPGKPLYVGMKDDTMIFGLPGNPASSLVCFYEFVRPALLQYMGYPESKCYLETRQARITKAIAKNDQKTHFLKARVFYDRDIAYAEPLADQKSHMMKTFAESNALIVLREEDKNISEGSCVTVHLL